MRLTIEGSPPPEAAAAIAAAVGALTGGGQPEDAQAGAPAWRLAGLREGVATPLRAGDITAARH